jgi:hypothetical protein
MPRFVGNHRLLGAKSYHRKLGTWYISKLVHYILFVLLCCFLATILTTHIRKNRKPVWLVNNKLKITWKEKGLYLTFYFSSRLGGLGEKKLCRNFELKPSKHRWKLTNRLHFLLYNHTHLQFRNARIFLQSPQYASKIRCAKFKIQTATLLKLHFFWDVTACVPVKNCRC